MNRFLIIILALATAFTASPAGRAGAQTPVTLTLKRDMKFGEWAPDPNFSGTIIIGASADSATSTGGVTSFGGQIRRARFQIDGESKTYVFVTLPSSITIRKGTTGNTMTVDSFTIDEPNPIYLGKNGRKTINIGATLRIGANQSPGAYESDNLFTVFVDY